MPSKNTKLKIEAEEREVARRQAFVDDVKKVEDQHGYTIVAEMNYRPNGLVAQLALVKREVKAEGVE
jgi:hypothetical protein